MQIRMRKQKEQDQQNHWNLPAESCHPLGVLSIFEGVFFTLPDERSDIVDHLPLPYNEIPTRRQKYAHIGDRDV